MFLFIDHYDSFSPTIVQSFERLGSRPVFVRHDDPALDGLLRDPSLERVCLSPGPGRPENATGSLKLLKSVEHKQIPVLGICLGHQILGHYGGLKVGEAERPRHGVPTLIRHDGGGILAGLPQNFKAALYNSLLVEGENSRVKISAANAYDEVMALSYVDEPWYGVQFHPESVLTPEGLKILAAFLSLDPQHKSAADSKVGLVGSEEPPAPISQLLDTLGRGEDLNEEAAYQFFSRLMDGELSPAQAGAFLLSLRVKGETALEMSQAARAVLERALTPPPIKGPAIDIVGTGGDGRNSFNCSTATALVLASMGHRVVKHGNRSVSSRSGSADVLERLGFPLDIPALDVPRLLDEKGFVFLFAPSFHPSFKHIMPVRRELGVRTLFNLLGPLVNPAQPSHRLIGAPNLEALPLLARTLAHMGGATSAVVHGAGGYDEMTTLGPAQVILVRDKDMSPMTVDPAAYGFKPSAPEDLAISGPEEGEAVLRRLLSGQGPKAMEDMLIMNVALGLYLLENDDMARCVARAGEAVREGGARRLLPRQGLHP